MTESEHLAGVIGPEHAVQRWRELPRSVGVLGLLAGLLYGLSLIWWPLGWLVVVLNAVFVIPTLLQGIITVLGFPFAVLGGGLKSGELRWAFSATVASLLGVLLEAVWMYWAITYLVRG